VFFFLAFVTPLVTSTHVHFITFLAWALLRCVIFFGFPYFCVLLFLFALSEVARVGSSTSGRTAVGTCYFCTVSTRNKPINLQSGVSLVWTFKSSKALQAH